MTDAQDVLNTLMGFAAKEYERGFKNGRESAIGSCDGCVHDQWLQVDDWFSIPRPKECFECIRSSYMRSDMYEQKVVE